MMKVGLIGCGGIAPLHIQAYTAIDDVEVIALCDLDSQKAKNLANKFHINKIYKNYWDMIDSNELDLIDICTPTTTHTQIVCDIAKAVPSIFLEKPMALTVSECDEIINSLNKYNTNCCIGHLQIFSPNIQKVKALIENDGFNLFSLKTTQKESYEILNAINLAPPWNVSEKHGGIIWEVCSHLAYLQLFFIPDIIEVYALGGKTKYEVHDNFAALLKTNDNRYGLIELNWTSKENDITYEFTDVNGERLKIHRDYNFISRHNKYPPHKVHAVMSNAYADQFRLFNKWTNFAVSYIKNDKIKPMFNLIGAYISSLKNGQPSPVTPKDGRKTVQLLESIKKSLDQNKPIKLQG